MQVIIMARAPRAGRVKTRLEPLLGAEGCARLQVELIRHTCAWVSQSRGSGWLAYSPAQAATEIRALMPPSIESFAQEGDDLGERMHHAAEHVFSRRRRPLAVIGTDCPELGPLHVAQAHRALGEGHDASLVPAFDGGYALIALARPLPEAFALPTEAWGGPDVLVLTLQALRQSGRSVAELEPVRDLDTPEDAALLAADPRCPEPIRQLLGPTR